MSVDDSDELVYLWTKIKFVKRYMTKNTGSNLEDAEKDFHRRIEGLLYSRIERINKMSSAWFPE